MTKSFEDAAKDIIRALVNLDKKDKIIEALVKQVQQLLVNYVAANNQQEKDTHEKENEAERTQLENISRINYCENELFVADKRKQQIQPDIPKKDLEYNQNQTQMTQGPQETHVVNFRYYREETSEEDNELFYNLWEEITSPAIYLTNIEEVLTQEDTEAEPTVEEQIKKEKIVEVYMMVGRRSEQKLEEDESRVDKKEADLPEFKEKIFELSA
ncbi:2576_t:CDS:2 [Racocetra fulgida]|uniref:2576_t:CDS:1 n=1 Tax=Racocetra fulgida TaxID=60492 RepID=A0A9N9AFF8_9GLOM|nr:2576_t:CDS:2 [Racocetra fulgida]